MSSENKSPWLRTIGAQLTCRGMAVTLLICAVLCLVLYFGLSFSLRSEVDRFLEGEVNEFATILRDEERADLGKIESEIRAELGSRSRGDLNFRLLAQSGDFVLTGMRQDRLPNPWQFPPSTILAMASRAF